jgi:hypothetical protein
MIRFLGEHVEFFRQYRQRFQTTGAVAPSSRFLARALAKPFEQHTGACRVLEVGPGTGAVTRRIVQMLKPADRFDLVELNDGTIAVIDFKSSKDAYPEQFWQCAGYDILVSENGGYTAEGEKLFDPPARRSNATEFREAIAVNHPSG